LAVTDRGAVSRWLATSGHHRHRHWVTSPRQYWVTVGWLGCLKQYWPIRFLTVNTPVSLSLMSSSPSSLDKVFNTATASSTLLPITSARESPSRFYVFSAWQVRRSHAQLLHIRPLHVSLLHLASIAFITPVIISSLSSWRHHAITTAHHATPRRRLHWSLLRRLFFLIYYAIIGWRIIDAIAGVATSAPYCRLHHY